MNQEYLNPVGRGGWRLDCWADDFQAVVDQLDPFDPTEKLLGHLLLIPGADVPVQHDPAAVGFEAEGAAGEIGVGDEGVINPLGERGREGGGGHGESLGVTRKRSPLSKTQHGAGIGFSPIELRNKLGKVFRFGPEKKTRCCRNP